MTETTTFAPPPPDRSLRMGAAAIAVALAAAAFLFRYSINPRIQAFLGIVAFIAVVAAFSQNLRAVSWRTVGWGMALQVGLALLILKFSIGGWGAGYVLFS